MAMSTATVTMFMGAPCSGKGTVIKSLQQEAISNGRKLTVIAPDAVIEGLQGYKELRSQGQSDEKARSQFHQEGTAKALQMFKEHVANMQNGDELIFDNTGGNLGRYQELIQEAKSHGVIVKVALVYTELQTCLERAPQRSDQFVPIQFIGQAHANSVNNFKVLSSECAWTIYCKNNGEPMEGRVVASSPVPGNQPMVLNALEELGINT
ncbi:MAG: zeta toxin family protein [Verrucomicrobia bacterium]|nr:zeta toxin family protein [Verrucomicrobiota bacterium]